MANLGVPVKLLHESLGHVITVELKTGEVSRAPPRAYQTVLIPEMPDVSGKVDGGCVSAATVQL